MMKKKYRVSSIVAGSLLTVSLLLSFVPLAADESADGPEMVKVFIETAENNSIYGDSILVIYKTPMLIPAQPHPLAGGMQDVNNVPGSELEAPAEYPGHQGNATARNAARNYLIKITPAPYSRTQPFEGTWADLGGDAIYHPADPNGRMILLRPPSKNSQFFEPGDRVEVTVAETVKGPHGQKIKPGKNTAWELAS